MEAFFYSPPIAAMMVFLALILVSGWFARYASKEEPGEHALDPYACGQRDVKNYVNPDYSQYYSFAFIFTVAHILILIVATAPSDAQILPIAYVVSGVLAILIALKR